MATSKSNKLAHIFIATVLIFISLFFAWQAVLLFNQPKPIPLDESVSSSNKLYPKLNLEFEHSKLTPTTGQTLQNSFQFLLDKLGYRETWEKFHYGPYIPGPENKLSPDIITILILPAEQYQQQQHGPLFNISKKDQGISAGYTCQLVEGETDLFCYFFLDDYFFEPEEPELAQLYLTNFLAINLMSMGSVERDLENEDQLFEELRQLSDQLQFSRPSPSSSLPAWLKRKWLALNKWLASPVQAQHCQGDLWCYLAVERCYCDNGDRCTRGAWCRDKSPNYLCPTSSCETTCEGSISFDPNENCYGLDDYPHCHVGNTPRCGTGGTCAGDPQGSCYAESYDPPDDPDDPTPGDPNLPDPDANCPVNKPEKWCVYDGHWQNMAPGTCNDTNCCWCDNMGVNVAYCGNEPDNILCCCPPYNPPDPYCGDPGRTDVTISNITTNSARIGWNGVGWGGESGSSCENPPDNPSGCSGRHWLVQILLNGNQVARSGCLGEGTRHWDVSGLEHSTHYEYRVWAINSCGCDKKARGGFNTRSHPQVSDASAPDDVCIGTQFSETINLTSSYIDWDLPSAGRFHDINIFQLNLEHQLSTNQYQQNDWPMRLMFAQQRPATNPNSFQFAIGGITSWSEHSSGYNSTTQRYYLDSNAANQYFTVLGGQNNTYFEIDNREIQANWRVQLHPNFPIPNDRQTYNVTSYVEDFEGAQDEDGDLHTGTVMHLNNQWYFHRLGEIDFIRPYLDIHLRNDSNAQAKASGQTCTTTGGSLPLINAQGNVTATVENVSGGLTDTENFGNNSQIRVRTKDCGVTYDITLNLDENEPYVCTCAASGTWTWECSYVNVPASYLSSEEVNFYITDEFLSNQSWFQTVGGSIYSPGDIVSYIPNDGVSDIYSISNPCVTGEGCQPALIAGRPYASAILNSPGFPLTQNGTIDTHKDGGAQLYNIHFDPNRSQAEDGRARDLNNPHRVQGYQYHYNLFGFKYHGDPGNHLSDANFPSLDLNQFNVRFYDGDLTISDAHSWSMLDGTQLVVFVDGNLTFTGNSDTSITQVPEGSFLAFIVSGDIIIGESVGYEAPEANTPLDPEIEIVAFATPDSVDPNLEGVFIADGTITIQGPPGGSTDGRDNKFIGAGSFIGWGGINLNRNFDDGVGGIGRGLNNYNPTETFIHRPDFLFNMPDEMMESIVEWAESLPEKP